MIEPIVCKTKKVVVPFVVARRNYRVIDENGYPFKLISSVDPTDTNAIGRDTWERQDGPQPLNAEYNTIIFEDL